MNYVVFTDGAYDKDLKIGSSAFFVRTDDRFISLKATAINTYGIKMAEVFAVAYALENLMDIVELKKTDKVFIKCDSQQALELIKALWEDPDEKWRRDEKLKICMQVLRRASKVCTLDMSYIPAHMDIATSNKFVDRLAKSSLYRCRQAIV